MNQNFIFMARTSPTRTITFPLANEGYKCVNLKGIGLNKL
jgi:hypothetical protein